MGLGIARRRRCGGASRRSGRRGGPDGRSAIAGPAVLSQLAGRSGNTRDEGSEQGVVVESLTARERDVLQLLAEGMANRAIASALGISEHTVKFHLASIFGKLGASTRTEAVRRGLRRGLIQI